MTLYTSTTFFNRAWLDIMFGKKIDSHCQTDTYLVVVQNVTWHVLSLLLTKYMLYKVSCQYFLVVATLKTKPWTNYSSDGSTDGLFSPKIRFSGIT